MTDLVLQLDHPDERLVALELEANHGVLFVLDVIIVLLFGSDLVHHSHGLEKRGWDILISLCSRIGQI